MELIGLGFWVDRAKDSPWKVRGAQQVAKHIYNP